MNLVAEVAKTYLNDLPERVVQRMLVEEGLANLVSEGAGEVAGIGSFKYSDLLAALANAPLNAAVPLSESLSSSATQLTRSSNGQHVLHGSAGASIPLPELGVLDPDSAIRQMALDALDGRARPWWPRASHWRELFRSRVPREAEFSCMLDELKSVGEFVLASISESSRKNRIGVPDLVPGDLEYFTSLVGPYPETSDASKYTKSTLVPHLERVLRRDTVWGLRCIQAISISTEVDPSHLTKGIASSALLSGLQQIGRGYTASSVLATFKIAQSRSREQPEFLPLADQCLDLMLDSCLRDETTYAIDDLYLALAKLTLRVISQLEPLASAPPYWRRLAAFVHAGFLLDTIDFRHSDIQSLVEWCDSQRSTAMVSADLFDQTVEPLWRGEAQSLSQLWASAVVRAVDWNSIDGSTGIEITNQQKERLDGISATLKFYAVSPDPLSGGKRRQLSTDVPEIGVELLDGEDGQGEALGSLTALQRWQALAYASHVYRFSHDLLVRVRREASSMSLVPAEGREVVYSLLESVAAIGATQPNSELAETVANAVLVAVSEFSDPGDILKGAATLVLASGFEPNEQARLSWVGDRLTGIAFRAQRGVPCARLATFIVSMQRFIRLPSREWGRAAAAARSALV